MLHRLVYIMIISLTFSYAQLSAQEEKSSSVEKEFKIETTIVDVLDKETAKIYDDVIKPNESINWSIKVPETYDPGIPPGILVQMSQNNLAKIPFGWASVLEEKNLIWISIDKTGVLKHSKEMLLSTLASVYLQSRFKINTDRIYLIASTDSCISASIAMQTFPQIFKGVIYSACEPINWKKNIPPKINEMKNNAYVFMSSSEKSIQRLMRQAERQYNNEGIMNTKFLYDPRLFYGENLSRQKFSQTIELLDDLH